MVDIPPPVTSVAIATTAAAITANEISLITAAIQNLPDKLQILTRQIQLTGTIINLIDLSTFTLRTAAGDVTLKLPPLPNGNPNPLAEQLAPLLQNQRLVNVVVQPGSPPTQALLILPQPLAAPHAAAAQNAAPQGFEGLGITQFTPIAAGQTLSAVVLPGPLGASFSVNPSSIPNPAPAPLITTDASGTSQPLKASLTSGNPSPPALHEASASTDKNIIGNNLLPRTEANLLKTGTELNFRINSVLMPNATIQTDDAPDKILATVVGKGPNGQLVLIASDHTLFVRQSSDLPVGSKLLLTLLPPAPDAVTFLTNPDEEAPALQQLMTLLQQINPQLAQQLMQTRIPRPGPALPGTLLFLFNVFQQGNTGGWLGEATLNQLDKVGKRDLLNKVLTELQHAGGNARDNTVGEWRSYPLPLHDHNQFQMLHLYVHQDSSRQKSDAEKRPGGTQTRFLINLNLTRLGALQMDGLAQKKQLDMMIRSERTLPPNLPDELRMLYINTLEAVGLAGSINFQTGRQNWVNIQRAATRAGVLT